MTLKNITLLIPTHNRPRYLSRILDYYSNIDVKIVVCDSSSNPFTRKMRKNVKYQYYKNYPYVSKIYECLKKINTPYVVICPDDDFIIPNAIKECISFLEKNPDYAAVDGESVMFLRDNGRFFMHHYAIQRGLDINFSRPSERLGNSLNICPYYGVHRIENLKQTFRSAQLIDYTFIEILLANIVVINGNYKHLPILYMLREFIPDSAGAKKILDLSQVIFSSANKKQYDLLLNISTKYLLKKENIDIKTAHHLIEKRIMNEIIYNKKNMKSFNIRLSKIIGGFSLPISNFLKRLRFKLFVMRKEMSSSIFGGSRYDVDDVKNLDKIKFFITKYKI